MRMENLNVLENPEVIELEAAFETALGSGNAAQIKEAATKLAQTKARVLKEWESSPEYAELVRRNNAAFRNRVAQLVALQVY